MGFTAVELAQIASRTLHTPVTADVFRQWARRGLLPVVGRSGRAALYDGVRARELLMTSEQRNPVKRAA